MIDKIVLLQLKTAAEHNRSMKRVQPKRLAQQQIARINRMKKYGIQENEIGEIVAEMDEQTLKKFLKRLKKGWA